MMNIIIGCGWSHNTYFLHDTNFQSIQYCMYIVFQLKSLFLFLPTFCLWKCRGEQKSLKKWKKMQQAKMGTTQLSMLYSIIFVSSYMLHAVSYMLECSSFVVKESS